MNQVQIPENLSNKIKILHVIIHPSTDLSLRDIPRFQNLEKLFITRDFTFLVADKAYWDNECIKSLGRRKTLVLWGLDYMCELDPNFSLILPNPEALIVDCCDGLVNLMSSSSFFHNLSVLIIRYSGNLETVVTSAMAESLQKLKAMHVSSCSKLINLLPSSASFQNLTILKVSFCESLVNLLTPMVAKSLVRLKLMCIEW